MQLHSLQGTPAFVFSFSWHIYIYQTVAYLHIRPLFLPQLMHLSRTMFSGLFILAGTAASYGQNALPAPEATSPSATSAESAPHKLLLKAGLNVGRSMRLTNLDGWSGRVPISLASEYSLSSKFTLYGQFDTDIALRRLPSDVGSGGLVPTGAIGVGGRCYYNQQKRSQANLAHGLFVGNYLGLEMHNELQRYGNFLRTGPSLNALWGMQRRLSDNFLFDFNAGVGYGPNSSANTGYITPAGTIATQFNMSIYFGN